MLLAACSCHISSRRRSAVCLLSTYESVSVAAFSQGCEPVLLSRQMAWRAATNLANPYRATVSEIPVFHSHIRCTESGNSGRLESVTSRTPSPWLPDRRGPDTKDTYGGLCVYRGEISGNRSRVLTEMCVPLGYLRKNNKCEIFYRPIYGCSDE